MMRPHTKFVAGLVAGLFIAILMVAGCASTNDTSGGGTGDSSTTQASQGDASEATVSRSASDPAVGVDWASLPTTDVTLSDDGVEITEAGTYVLTGSSTGQVTVNTGSVVRIVLDGVTINSSESAAIQVDKAELTVIELADGATNTVSDAATRSDETIDAAIYSSDDLSITGGGTLAVTANFADGIVGKDDVWITSGVVHVTSVDDGIRGKDSLNIEGGTITIDAAGDGLKATNDTDLGRGQLTVTDGTITIASGDDAFNAEQHIWITGGTIDITESVEGIEAPVIVIDGGDISITASDDGINASTSGIITSGLSITINGGNITIVMAAGDTDAIDSNGDFTITGGTLDITAQSPFDYDGTGTFTGGTITVNGEPITELTNQMMGGGPIGGGPGGGGGGGRPGRGSGG